MSASSGLSPQILLGKIADSLRVMAGRQPLAGSFGADALDGIGTDADNMISDIHASGEYRAHLVGEIAKRAVSAC